MDNLRWFIVVLQKFADFSGRASRAEYWWYILGYVIVYVAAVIFDDILGLNNTGMEYGVITTVVILLFFLPSLSVSIRRLHDVDKSGWWLLVNFIPFGVFVILYFQLLKGTAGDNKYGPQPPSSPPTGR